jgi:spore maturation protein CgeB
MHLAVLNMRSEGNVVNGLNQRNFDPYLCATPVVAEDQPDLTACFEPGKEVVVWRDVAELNAIYSALRQDPARAAAIGLAGQRRVLADHSYGRRLEILARELGI